MRRLAPVWLTLAWSIFAATSSAAERLRVMMIGDSLTDEYDAVSQLAALIPIGPVYPEPDFPNPDHHPTARNWPEILDTHRGHELDFGADQAWPTDLRIRGFEFNFAVVGTKASDWVRLLTSPIWSLSLAEGLTRQALETTLSEVHVVVIFVGGNDLEDYYGGLSNGNPAPQLLTQIAADLDTLHREFRQRVPDLPIVVATLPDVGAAPVIYKDTYPGPSPLPAARTAIRAMNQAIANDFSQRPLTAVARIDRVTDPLLDIVQGVVPGPFDLNGTPFIIEGDPFNPPNHLFCKDDFHPNTVGQALIANEIIAGLNTLFPSSVTPLPQREILGTVLGLDPDQPYLDWAADQGLADSDPQADPDGDGLSNLVEMILGTSPVQGRQGLTYDPSGLSWQPADEHYATLQAEESADLTDWHPVPSSRLSTTGSTRRATRDEQASRTFLRLRAVPRP